MNKYRIVLRKWEGFDRYVVQEKILWWWSDFKPTHVGNNNLDMYTEHGYYHIEAARKQFEILTAHKYVGQEVVE